MFDLPLETILKQRKNIKKLKNIIKDITNKEYLIDNIELIYNTKYQEGVICIFSKYDYTNQDLEIIQEIIQKLKEEFLEEMILLMENLYFSGIELYDNMIALGNIPKLFSIVDYN